MNEEVKMAPIPQEEVDAEPLARKMLKALSEEDTIDHAVVIVARQDGILTLHSSTGDLGAVALWMQRQLAHIYSPPANPQGPLNG